MSQYIVDEHIRRLPGVSGVHFSPVVSWAKNYPVPVKLDSLRSEHPLCGLLPYCPKCPGNPNYNGKIFNGKSVTGGHLRFKES